MTIFRMCADPFQRGIRALAAAPDTPKRERCSERVEHRFRTGRHQSLVHIRCVDWKNDELIVGESVGHGQLDTTTEVPVALQ